MFSCCSHPMAARTRPVVHIYVQVLRDDLVPRLRLLRLVNAEVDKVLKPLYTNVGWGCVLRQVGGCASE